MAIHCRAVKNSLRGTSTFFLLFLLVVKGSRSGSVEIITDPDSDPGGQKTYRSYGSTILQYYIGANSFSSKF
jgi:hypothetical protein